MVERRALEFRGSHGLVPMHSWMDQEPMPFAAAALHLVIKCSGAHSRWLWSPRFRLYRFIFDFQNSFLVSRSNLNSWSHLHLVYLWLVVPTRARNRSSKAHIELCLLLCSTNWSGFCCLLPSAHGFLNSFRSPIAEPFAHSFRKSLHLKLIVPSSHLNLAELYGSRKSL
jgi:hypothetical protein